MALLKTQRKVPGRARVRLHVMIYLRTLFTVVGEADVVCMLASVLGKGDDRRLSVWMIDGAEVSSWVPP